MNEGAVESKTDFYEQYANRDYHYPAEYVDKIKELFLNTGASSIVNQKAVINAFDAYGTIGRGTDGNFVTSIADDSRLCFDGEKAKDAETIAVVKGVGTITYASGRYQYEYDAEMVNSCNGMGLLQTLTGNTGGASLLNIPGCKTCAEEINNLESELMMPSVICNGYVFDQIFSDILNKGCFEIQNPRVLLPNGDEVQVKGCFRIKEI